MKVICVLFGEGGIESRKPVGGSALTGTLSANGVLWALGL